MPYLLALALVAPGLLWICLDQSVWHWDPSWYGQVSVELWDALWRGPAEWTMAMATAFGQKPPAIAWLGQFLVPIGRRMGRMEPALLSSLLLTQVLTLALILKALRALSGNQTLIAMTGCALAGAAPLFVALSHLFFAESIQTMSVAWFLVIAAMAPRWPRSLLLGQLLAAAALAVLTKISTPLYVLLPGLLALWFVCRPRRHASLAVTRKLWTALTWVAAATLLLGAAGWYYKSWRMAFWHLQVNSYVPATAIQGSPATVLGRQLYARVFEFQASFGFAPVFWSWLLLLVLGTGAWFARRGWRAGERGGGFSHFDLCALVAALQIALVMFAFSFTAVGDTRYFLPVLPWFSVLVAWALHRLDRPALSGLVLASLLMQWALVYGQAFGAWRFDSIPELLFRPERNPAAAQMLRAGIDCTCREPADALRYNLIGVEYPSFNANAASFYEAQSRPARGFRCFYTSLGLGETDAGRDWDRLRAMRVRYFITWDPAARPLPANGANMTAESIRTRVGQSGLYAPVAAPPGTLIFREKE
ncbi:MAG: hypothetical protein ACKV2V_25750 [Blastocatellia bacterium]